MNTIRQITKWYVTVIVSVVFALCAIVYYNSIGELTGTADIVDALKFLFTSPKEYVLCLICGAIAKAAFIAIILVALASILWLVKAFVFEGYVSGEIELTEIIWNIINCILAIVIGIVQTNIIVNWFLLVITIGLILFGLKLWADSSTSY